MAGISWEYFQVNRYQNRFIVIEIEPIDVFNVALTYVWFKM